MIGIKGGELVGHVPDGNSLRVESHYADFIGLCTDHRGTCTGWLHVRRDSVRCHWSAFTEHDAAPSGTSGSAATARAGAQSRGYGAGRARGNDEPNDATTAKAHATSRGVRLDMDGGSVSFP